MRLAFNIGIVFSWVLALQSCSPQNKIWVGEHGNQKSYNIPYGAHTRQKLDLWLPDKDLKGKPLVMMIHGGAWKIGNKRHLLDIQKMLHENGYPTMSMNYRLANHGITYENQLEDVQSAWEYYQKLRKEYPHLPEKVVLFGESAGGHLALLYAYRNPDKIARVISLAGPVDFYSEEYRNSSYHKYTYWLIKTIFGNKRNRLTEEDLKKASPLSQVSSVPTLAFQGTKDLLVNVNQGKSLDKVLKEKNIPHRFVLSEGRGHVTRFVSKEWREKVLYPEILQFLSLSDEEVKALE